MLQRFLNIPNSTIAKLNLFNPVGTCEHKGVGFGYIFNGDLIRCARDTERQRGAIAIAQVIKIIPTQIIHELDGIGVGIAG